MELILINNFASDSAESIGALGFDLRAFIIQIITFGLAYLVLRKWAFGPILEVLKRRREQIDSTVTLAEKLEKEQAQLDIKVEKTLSETRSKADEIINEANSVAREAIRKAEEDARAKAKGILAEAEARIVTETTRARANLEKEMVGLISEATEAIIEQKIDAKKDASIIEKALQRGKA